MGKHSCGGCTQPTPVVCVPGVPGCLLSVPTCGMLCCCCRLVLEASGEALAAAAPLHTVAPARTGVFVGISWTEYARMASDAGTGGWGSGMPPAHRVLSVGLQVACRVKRTSACSSAHQHSCPLVPARCACSRERLHRPGCGAECVPWPGGLPLCPQGARCGCGHRLLLLPCGNQFR